MPTYMTIRMTRDHDYKDRQLRAGDTVELPRRAAALLMAARKATKVGFTIDSAPTSEPTTAPLAPPTPASAPAAIAPDDVAGPTAPPPGDDLTALRARYKEVVGKQPHMGWDADKLREKIAAAKAEPQS